MPRSRVRDYAIRCAVLASPSPKLRLHRHKRLPLLSQTEAQLILFGSANLGFRLTLLWLRLRRTATGRSIIWNGQGQHVGYFSQPLCKAAVVVGINYRSCSSVYEISEAVASMLPPLVSLSTVVLSIQGLEWYLASQMYGAMIGSFVIFVHSCTQKI